MCKFDMKHDWTDDNKGRFPPRKISIGSVGLFLILYYPHRQTKKVENASTLYHPGCGSKVQTGTENWFRTPMRGFNYVPIRSDPILIFLSGNRLFVYATGLLV